MGSGTGPDHEAEPPVAETGSEAKGAPFVESGELGAPVRGKAEAEAIRRLARAAGRGNVDQVHLLQRLQQSAGNAAVGRLLRGVSPSAAGEARAAPARPAHLIVDGSAGPGQTEKGDFLDLIEDGVRPVAEAGLAGTVFTAAGCPWVGHWIGYYRTRPASELEDALLRYAPDARDAGSAQDVVAAVCRRLADGIAEWRRTGTVPNVANSAGSAGDGDGSGRGDGGGTAGVSVARVALARKPDPGAALDQLGPGRALREAERQVAYAFAADLGGVRVHDDPAGSALARQLDAHAAAVGNHVVFARGVYAPGTAIGDALLAHELAHVVQQRSDGRRSGTAARGGTAEVDLERDANAGAARALARVLSGPDVAAAQPRRTTGLALQRCGDNVYVPPLPAQRTYDQVVADLRRVAEHKRAVAAGRETEDPALLATEPDLIEELQRMGIRLEDLEIMDRLLADPTVDLRRVRGRIVRSPAGEVHWGERVTLQAQLDYVPPGRNVEYEWRWKAGHGEPEFDFGQAPRRGSHDRVEIGEGFWLTERDGRVGRSRKLEVTTKVYLGKETTEQTMLTTGELAIGTERVPHPLTLVADPTIPIVGGIVRFRVADWAPEWIQHELTWEIDGRVAASDTVGFQYAFPTAGNHTVGLRVNRVRRSLGIQERHPLTDGQLAVTVEDVSQASTRMLDQMRPGTSTLPATSDLEASLVSSIREIERHAAEGGEQRDYWVERLKVQRERLDALRRYAFDLSTAGTLPADPLALEAGHAYNGPIPAVLSMPNAAGVQPLTIQVSVHQEGNTWVSRLIDMTSKDVYDREGRGSTPLEAHRAAFRAWINDHPYPRHGTVTYRFPAQGWDVPTSFLTKDTAWDTAVAWLDGIVTVGGYISAGLLLAAPEATVTKWLGYTILALSVARSGIAIYENLNSGVAITDTRNVLEGISILTSVLGVGGSQLRAAGIRYVRPAMMRVGTASMMIGFGTQAATVVIIGSEGLDQLRAVQADPTLDEGQKAAAVVRLIGVLGVQSLLLFQSARDLVRQGLSLSDFIRRDPRASAIVGPGGEIRLTTGSRLDVAVDFRRAGDTHMAERTINGTMPDSELLDRHAMLPWLTNLTAADVADLSRRLSTRAMTRLQGISAVEARTALNQVGDDALFNQLAVTYGGPRARAMAPGIGTIRSTLAGDTQRLGLLGQVAELEATGKVIGFEQWVSQTSSRVTPHATPAQRAEQVADVQRLTSELSALQAVAAQEAANANTVVRFNPAPATVAGTPTPRSFDIHVEQRAPAGGVAAAPSRMIEVEAVTGQVRAPRDLHTAIAHAASKLPLNRAPGTPATPIPGTPMPGGSAEAGVVLPGGWPPPPATPAPLTPGGPPGPGTTTTYHPDGTYTQDFGGGRTRGGDFVEDLLNDLNGRLRPDGTRGQSPMDPGGVQYLDQVNIIDGRSGRAVFTLVNDPAPGGVRAARHSWRRQ